MIIEFVCKNYNPSDKLKDVIDKKVQRLDKFFVDEDTRIKVLLKQVKENANTLELTIVLDNTVLRAEVTGENMYNNIDLAIPKIEKQIIKYHKKLIGKSKKVREKILVEEPEKEEAYEPKVVRTKVFNLTPMTIEDAIEELELTQHSFFVFLNKADGRINVLYKRVDGDYGLIETTV